MSDNTATHDTVQDYTEDQYVTVEELAHHLRVPVTWVYAQTRKGTIPFLKAGKYCRFKIPQVEASLASQARSEAA